MDAQRVAKVGHTVDHPLVQVQHELALLVGLAVRPVLGLPDEALQEAHDRVGVRQLHRAKRGGAGAPGSAYRSLLVTERAIE